MLNTYIVRFPVGAGWTIECEQHALSASNAELNARREVRAIFPHWEDVVDGTKADVRPKHVESCDVLRFPTIKQACTCHRQSAAGASA